MQVPNSKGPMTEQKQVVMLVDDDPINNLVNKRLLRKYNDRLSVVEYQMAYDALEHFKTDRPKPDVLLLDINMPKMNGWQFLEEFEKIWAGELKIVMLTSSIDLSDQQKAESLPLVSGYLTKPLNMDKIQTIFDEM
jgi:CheY-like chemotaxis protein